MELKKEAFRIQQEVWNFTKKYIENIQDNQSDAYWDGIRDDASAIHDSTNAQPEYVRQFAQDMLLASITMLEKIYREEKRK